jgi:uncharacterized DUF497 family protein
MRLFFDPVKDARNKTKHGLSLSLAHHVFNDPHVLIIYDRYENGGDRYHAIARVASKFLLLVHGYPDPDDEDCIRAISLREATLRERRHYERREDEILGKRASH